MLRVLSSYGKWKPLCASAQIQSCLDRLLCTSLDCRPQTSLREMEAKEDILQTKNDQDTALMKSSKETKVFNSKALMDLCLEKFDDALFQYPLVLNEKRWGELIDRGDGVEDYIKTVKYDKILAESKIGEDVRDKLAGLGVFRMRIPEEYGGLGFTETERNYIHEILAYCPSIARMVSENEEMGIKILVKYGTEQQKQKYLPKLATGESMITCAFLEEMSHILDAKSYLKTKAILNDGTFTLKGFKEWVYNATVADLFIVFATQIAEDEQGEFPLSSLFLVERDTEGLRVHKPIEKKWFKGVDISKVYFHDVEVGHDAILGGLGKGFEILQDVVKHHKTAMNAETVASMKRLLHDAIATCINCKLIGTGESDYNKYEVLISELSCLVYVAESMTYYLSARTDYYNNPNMEFEVLLNKVFIADLLPKCLMLYFSILGKYGYEKKPFVEELAQNCHYLSLLDDSTFNVKLLIMSHTVKYVAKKMVAKYDQMKNPLNNVVPVLKQNLRSERMEEDTAQPYLKLSKKLSRQLKACANDLEYSISRLAFITERQILRHGDQVLKHDFDLLILCDILALTYAQIACIARASYAIEKIGRLKCTDAVKLTHLFTSNAAAKIRAMTQFMVTNQEEMECYAEVGRKTFKKRFYLPEHPLTRTY